MIYADTVDSTVELVEAAAAGDGAAFSTLCRHYKNFAKAVIIRTLGRADIVDEILQETFIVAWRKLSALRNPHAFRPWLGRIAVTTSLNSIRRNNIQKRTVSGDDLSFVIVRDRANGPVAELIEDEFFERHRRILAKMKPDDREILTARIHDGLSMEELAGTFDVPLGTAKRRLHTARNRYMALN